MSSNLAKCVLLVLTSVSLTAGCSPGDRGTWWYRHPGDVPADAYGIEEVFAGTGALTTTGVADALLDCEVGRLYGSYGPMSGSNIPPANDVALFNQELHARGITSQFLFSEPSYLTNPASLITKIVTRVIDFNAARPDLTEHFDAVHLDVEPVQFPECKMATLDPVACHDRVQDLLSLIFQVRNLLLDRAPKVALYVDLHDWIDIVEGGRIFWPPAPTPEFSRNTWFQGIDGSVDGVSIMAYGHTDVADIFNAASWEVQNLSTADVRVGINLDAATSFPDVASMTTAALLLELLYGVPVDLHSLNDTLALGGCS